MLNQPAIGSKSKLADSIPEFWQLLGVFWNEDRIARWKKIVFPDPSNPATGVESCVNLICLSPDAHSMWNKGIFALKPLGLSPDKKELTIQFFWQPQYSHKPGDRIDLLTEPRPSRGLKSIGEDYCLTYPRGGSSHDIESGQIFKIATENPRSNPLPSWDLLEMQWFLQRLTAMAGAADWPRFEFDDDDTDCIPVLVDEINDCNWGYEDVYDWVPVPEESEQGWVGTGFSGEICAS
jgi:hypothetical protein